MCTPKNIIGGLLGVVAGGLMGGDKPDNSANEQAQKNADRAYQQAEQANNKANAKSPNTQNLLDENVQAALGGTSSTMLTGPQGVDPATLLLGKNTLLGQ